VEKYYFQIQGIVLHKNMRIKTHVIDTQARKLVPNVFPNEWEHREITGRDYGIDMEIELFEQGNPTGQILLLQIKGTTKIIPNDIKKYFSFSIETKTLKYAERFITPFLLVICPVNEKPIKAYYIWLQDYIKTCLDIDKIKWRNQEDVTLHIPKNNIMPNNEKHLSFISLFPKRLYSISEIGKFSHELKFLEQSCEYDKKNYLRLMDYFNNIIDITIKMDWPRSSFILENNIYPAVKACKCINKNSPMSKDDIDYFESKNGWINKEEYIEYSLKFIIHDAIEKLHFYFEETNYDMKNFIWNEYECHDF
jgi:hypothetical protein